jgi:hypothetical protein
MKTLTVKDSKYGFGRLMDLVRAGSEAVPKKFPNPATPNMWCVSPVIVL